MDILNPGEKKIILDGNSRIRYMHITREIEYLNSATHKIYIIISGLWISYR